MKKIEKLSVHEFNHDGTIGNCLVCHRGPYSNEEHDQGKNRAKINEIIERLNGK